MVIARIENKFQALFFHLALEIQPMSVSSFSFFHSDFPALYVFPTPSFFFLSDCYFAFLFSCFVAFLHSCILAFLHPSRFCVFAFMRSFVLTFLLSEIRNDAPYDFQPQ